MFLQCDNAPNCVLHLIGRGRKFNIGSSDAKFDTFCVHLLYYYKVFANYQSKPFEM